MIKDMATGAHYVRRGFQLVREPKLRKFVVIPLSINIVLFLGLIWLLGGFYADLLQGVSSDESVSGWREYWLVDSLFSLLEALFWLFFGVAMILMITYTFTLVANLIAAPFNSLLAEKVERHLTGEFSTEDSWKHVVKSIPKVLASEFKKMLYMLMWSLPLIILSIIPVTQIIAPLLWFTFGAWLLSLEYLDYPMGNHHHTFQSIRATMRKNRGLATGFGSLTLLLTSIPFVNMFMMPIAVAGATALWLDKLSHQTEAP